MAIKPFSFREALEKARYEQSIEKAIDDFWDSVIRQYSINSIDSIGFSIVGDEYNDSYCNIVASYFFRDSPNYDDYTSYKWENVFSLDECKEILKIIERKLKSEDFELEYLITQPTKIGEKMVRRKFKVKL